MGIKFWLRDKKNLVFLALVLVLLTMPFVLTLFRLTLLGKFICYAIVALGIDLIWGIRASLALDTVSSLASVLMPWQCI